MISIKNLLKKSTVKNSIWIIGEKVMQMIITFIVTMFSARYLGPSNYGVLSYGVAFVTFFTSIVKLGLDSIIVKELIDNKNEQGKILGTSIVMRLISSGISILLILICVFVLNINNGLIILTTFLQSLSLIFIALGFFDYWFQSKLKSKYVSISKSISYIIACLYKVILLIFKFDVYWFALSTVLDYFLISVSLFLFYKKNKGPKLSYDKELGINLLKKSYHFIISGIMVVIYTQIDKVMLGHMIDETAIGLYSAALTVHAAYGFIPDAIIVSARPTIYNAQKNDECLYYKRLKQTYCLIFWLCVLMSFILTIFSDTIIAILYGKDFIGASIVLKVLAWAVPFAYIGTARGIWLVGEGLNKYSKKYLFWGVLLNVVLNVILILKIGIVGAAYATLITEIFTCFISPLFYKKTRSFPMIALKGIMFNWR